MFTLFLMPVLCQTPADVGDWPMYNRDLSGHRHNTAEKVLNPGSVGQLKEIWRFPAKDATKKIGIVHATPIVVDGCVYFGTATDTAFYKVGPDGKEQWVFKYSRVKPQAAAGAAPAESTPKVQGRNNLPAGMQGIMASALVHGDNVYFADLSGLAFALDRNTGKERWRIDATAADFPERHPLNCFFASPVPVEGFILFAGGAFEHGAAANARYKASGRGFVMAVEPATGKIAWKYDVGPKPAPLDPPVVIEDAWGKHTFTHGPATSSIWCTPSHDAESHTIFFGTDTLNAPRQPTPEDSKLYNRYACALVALDARTGKEKWVTQINADDVWNYGLRAYDPKTGLYKDSSIGDTPKLMTALYEGKPTKVVGSGCKNGGFFVARAEDGKMLFHTPVYNGKPVFPPSPAPDPRTLALPSPIGGLQTGCASDGVRVFTNGIDHLLLGTGESLLGSLGAPTGGRVTCISTDTKQEFWRHERPKVASVGRYAQVMSFKNVGDPVGSGIAVAGGVLFFTTTVSNKLVALEADSGRLLKEIELGPVWCGPSVSRGRVYVGTGNMLFRQDEFESYFPKKYNGSVICFGVAAEEKK